MVPPSIPTELLPRIARAAEDAGLDYLWVCEDCYATSAVASAAIALGATERIRVGTGFLSAPLRNVAAAAMDFAMLARIHPGRVVPGVGHGFQPHMAQVGAKAASPLALLEEHATALRALLDGEEVTVHGRYVRLEGVRLQWPPTERLPIMIGAQSPKTLGLAGRIGDGTLLTSFLAAGEIADSIEHIAPAPGHRIALGRTVAVGPGAQKRLAEDPGHYPEISMPGGAKPGVAGGADEVAAGLRQLLGMGVTDIIVSPTANEPDLFGFIATLGSQVWPLAAAG
jgi:alkanesulfonate monooxygenase SsuD/methylene tetrahydromethanopterin reductase-like flavin-dependent oxidoreductase (luciferase family)